LSEEEWISVASFQKMEQMIWEDAIQPRKSKVTQKNVSIENKVKAEQETAKIQLALPILPLPHHFPKGSTTLMTFGSCNGAYRRRVTSFPVGMLRGEEEEAP
jgi:hypothetical protein